MKDLLITLAVLCLATISAIISIAIGFKIAAIITNL